MNQPQPLQILEMDRRRGNIVVSRRTVLEEPAPSSAEELVENLEEGQIFDGVVKNITDYGASSISAVSTASCTSPISPGGGQSPHRVAQYRPQVRVKIIKINHETHRISLGMKTLQEDPWQGIQANIRWHEFHRRSRTSPTTARSELEPGIEGPIHVSEMSWTRRRAPRQDHPTSQEVDVKIRGRCG